MSEESDLVAKIITNDINTLVEDLNNVIKAHNVLVDENQQLKIQISARETVCDELQKRINKVEKGIKHYMSYNTNEGLLEYCMRDLLSLLKGDKE